MPKKQSVPSYHEIAQIAAEAGARAGVEAYEQEKTKAKKDRIDRRLRNTRLLLRKYRLFKMHSENAVFTDDTTDSNISAYDILEEMASYDETLIVESISRSAKRTQIIVEHINTMLGLYHAYCSRSPRQEDMRHYRVIEALYIADSQCTAKDVAEWESVDERTVYRDVDTAVGILSALLFGIDSIGPM